MPELDAILFDFDGVLADTEPVHWACWAEVLKPFGIALEWEYYRDHGIGIDDKEMLRTLAGLAHPPLDWRTLFAEYPRKKELFRRRVLAHPPFDPALDAFLDNLHRTYRLAVVTSSARGEIDPLLAAGGLRHHFDALVGAEDVTHYKPDPEPYRKAAELLGARTPLVVEDSAAGIASGRAAGFAVLATPEPSQMPALVTRRLAERAG
ncbi:MAG TPA: HAD-IA family hydrolase [Bryobacteraceae bacterium]|jgi:HAD superfamily hydrolase (TIGR01509 family)